MEDDSTGGRQISWFEGLKRLMLGRRRVMSERELQEIIEESEEEGIINEDEGDMLHSIFEFGETIVREIMVPRTEMVSCDKNSSLRAVLDTIIESGHSRVPIFDGTKDKIVGFIYAKDLLKLWGEDPESAAIDRIIRPP